AQCQPCLISITNTNIGGTAAHDWHRVWPSQPLARNVQLKRTRGRLQFSLIIDQVPASGTARQIAHEYYWQSRVDLGFQTCAGTLIAAAIIFASAAVFAQPCDHPRIT